MASAQDKASASANAHASASGLLSVPVLLPMRVSGTCSHRVLDFGTAYIRALVESGPASRLLETDCMACLHFGSLCCRFRRMSLNGYLRGDQHVWHLLKIRPAPVLMLTPVPVAFCQCLCYCQCECQGLAAIVSVILARLTSGHLWSFKFLSVAQLMLVSDIAPGFLEKDPCLSHGQAAPNSNEALQTLWE